jgi:anti-anti-sigma factor
MSDLASFVVARRDDIVIGELTGEIDQSDAAELEGLITDAVPNSVRGLVLDLSGVTYIDSAGVRLLLSLAGRLRWRGQNLVLAAPPDSRSRRVLSMVGVGSKVMLETNVDAAVSRMRASGSTA